MRKHRSALVFLTKLSLLFPLDCFVFLPPPSSVDCCPNRFSAFGLKLDSKDRLISENRRRRLLPLVTFANAPTRWQTAMYGRPKTPYKTFLYTHSPSPTATRDPLSGDGGGCQLGRLRRAVCTAVVDDADANAPAVVICC